MERHHPVGATVTGVDLAGRVDVDALCGLLADHGVVVLPGQALDDAAFVDWLRSIGETAFTAGEVPVDGHPELNVVSNVGRSEPPRSSFHVDTSYVATPPAYTALRAVQVPVRGGATVFTNQYRAADTLPPALRAEVQGRSITHVVSGVDPGAGAETAAEHPVLRPHPVTGRAALYLSTPQRCASVSGLGPEAGRRLVGRLVAHSTEPGNTWAHTWAPGDVVVWDNSAVMHKADHDGVVGDRVLHRGMVARYRPARASATPTAKSSLSPIPAAAAMTETTDEGA